MPDASGPSASAEEPPASAPSVPGPLRPAAFDVAAAMATVEHLAGRIGARQATGPAYRRAADWVAARFTALGYDVARHRFRVPAGVSWGVPVPAGSSINVVATLPGTDLDAAATCSSAPTSTPSRRRRAPRTTPPGVGVLLAAAEPRPSRRTRLPVVLRRLRGRGAARPDRRRPPLRLARLRRRPWRRPQRRALRGMVSLDRVGVGTVVPVCSAVGGRRPGPGSSCWRRAAAPASPTVRLPRTGPATTGRSCGTGCRASGSAARRTPATTRPDDVPGVVGRRQLDRTGRLRARVARALTVSGERERAGGSVDHTSSRIRRAAAPGDRDAGAKPVVQSGRARARRASARRPRTSRSA